MNLVGLWECARVICEASEQSDESAQARMASALISYMSFKLKELSAAHSIDIQLCGDATPESAGRAASIDMRLRSEEVNHVFGISLPYSRGFSMPSSTHTGDWQSRLEAEAALHALSSSATLVLGREASTISAASLVQFIARIAATPTLPASQLKVNVAMRQCSSCGNMASVSTGTCSACGATQWSVPSGQKLLFEVDPSDSPDDPPGTQSSYSLM